MFHLEYKILFWIFVCQTLKSCNTRHPNFPSLIEQLSTEVRQKVVKMSEARLRQKLVQAGYRVVDIYLHLTGLLYLSIMPRCYWPRRHNVPAKEEQYEDEDGGGDGEEEAEFVESQAGVQHTAGGEMSVEEKRLAMEERLILLEERKLEEQRLQREEQRKQRELEEKRCEQQLEQQRMQLEEQRLQREEQRMHRELEKRCELQWEEQRKQREFEEKKMERR